MNIAMAALLSLLIMTGTVNADTFQYDATTDFESLDEGAAPFYIDSRRDALAIDATNEEYREVFARASTTFTETAGKYDVTISALGEIDGECEYRFLINGVVVGTAVNQPVSNDYALQQHTFAGISIPTGAVMSVESNALTNGLIPEGDGTAYARGRWQALTLETSEAADTMIDLSIAATAPIDTPAVNEQYVVTFTVSNDSDEVATNPVVSLPEPDNTRLTHDSSCAAADAEIRCALAELAPGESTTLDVTATTSVAGMVNISATVDADQSDIDTSNNNANTQVQVNTPTPDTVDLALSVSSSADTVDAGQTVEYRFTVSNQHPQTTATAPITGTVLPARLVFESSADCIATGQIINCALPELAPNQSTTVVFTATAAQPGSAALIASVSANEPETTVDNNEVTHTITVTENRANIDDSSTTSDRDSEDAGDSSDTMSTGTGVFSPGALLWFLIFVTARLRKTTPQKKR